MTASSLLPLQPLGRITAVAAKEKPEKTEVPKLRVPPAVLEASSARVWLAVVPGEACRTDLATVLCLLWAVAMPRSGVSVGEAQGQVWLSPATPAQPGLPAAPSPVTPRGQIPELGMSLCLSKRVAPTLGPESGQHHPGTSWSPGPRSLEVGGPPRQPILLPLCFVTQAPRG